MSLKEIAQMVGVAPSTVSRVLNNTVSTCASPELKKKIWEAARTLNYVPDINARNLKKGKYNSDKKYKIAIILARFNSLETDPFFHELFQSVEESLFSYSCTIQFIINVKQKNFKDLMKEIDGAIVLGRCSDESLNAIKKYTKNIVGIGRNPTSYKMDEIICNGKTAAITAMEYLLSLGHREIGYIGDCSSESRYVGYCETLINRNIPLNYNYIQSTDQAYDSGYHAMQKLRQQNLTAVFCANDISALGALKALSESSPNTDKKKISVISIDNISLSQTSTPLLTTVSIPKEDMGRMAVNILLDRIKHNHSEFLRVEFPCKIIERESCHSLMQ